MTDKNPVFVIGSSCSIISILVFALYLSSPSVEKLYSHPQYLWPATIVLFYWTCRVWILAHRDLIHDDPVVFAIKDKAAWLGILGIGVIFWIAK